MNVDARAYLRFLASCGWFACSCVVLTMPLLAFYIHQLKSVGEFVSGRDVAEVAAREPILWASNYFDIASHLKIDVSSEIKPRVVALGSSRVMQFRGRMFNRLAPHEFYNVGGGVRGFHEAIDCIDAMVAADAKPEMVILGVDWWWLQSHKTETDSWKDFWDRHGGRALSNGKKKLQKQMAFFLDRIQLLQSAWRDPRIHEAWFSGPRRDPQTQRRLLGAHRQGGFRNDGSYRYAQYIANPPPLESRRAEGFERFERGKYRGNGIHMSHLVDCESFLARCQRHGIQVIVILPPVDRLVLERFRASVHSKDFWAQAPRSLSGVCENHGAVFADLSDPTSLQAADEEFVDWFHGSDKLYGRIVNQLANRETTAHILAPYVDADKLDIDLENSVSPLDLYGD